METKPYIVYVKTDEYNRIVSINSSAFLMDTDGWIEIDTGFDDRYHHAQNNYLDKTLYDKRGIIRYKLVDGKSVERTQAEMDADYIPPVHQPDPFERIAALENALRAIEEGIASV